MHSPPLPYVGHLNNNNKNNKKKIMESYASNQGNTAYSGYLSDERSRRFGDTD